MSPRSQIHMKKDGQHSLKRWTAFFEALQKILKKIEPEISIYYECEKLV